MIKKIYIIMLQALIALPTFAMQEQSCLHHELTVPNEKRCHSVAFYQDKLIIAGANGVDIYDNTTKTISNISDNQTFHIAVHPSLPHVAISNKIELAIYNIHSKEKIWEHDPMPSWPLVSISFNFKDLTIHSYYRGKETLYNTTEELIQQDEPLDAEAIDSIISRQHSPDKKTIAIRNRYRKCSLYNIKNKEFYFWDIQHYISTAFHPTKKIIALLTMNGAVEYWNYITHKLIAITNNFYNNASTKKLFSRTKRLDFSPDGKHLAVGLAYNCLILPTPTTHLAMLHHLLLKETDPDIAQQIIHLLPQVTEMHYFDFVELSKTY